MSRDDRVDEFLLLRGLFMTSFLADDFLGDHGFRGASQTLVTSASSKTSICLAFCPSRRGHRSVGLTSSRNLAFVEGLDLYDEVVVYDDIHQLDPAAASGLVDMAGSAAVRSGVHTHFGDRLQFSLTDRGGLPRLARRPGRSRYRLCGFDVARGAGVTFVPGAVTVEPRAFTTSPILIARASTSIASCTGIRWGRHFAGSKAIGDRSVEWMFEFHGAG